MPSNGQFGFSVLVGGRTLPEYNHPDDNTRVFVESILWSPVSYELTTKEYCETSEEIEIQKWPVTPYEVKVFVEPSCREKHLYKVFVDGINVGELWLERGQSKILSGFPEENGSYREFLFSLPRFANNTKDRVTETRGHKVGKIEVICYEISFSHNEKRQKNSSKVDFSQANKMDVYDITKKKYTMATTRVGRLLRDGKPYDKPAPMKKEIKELEDRSIWNVGDEVQKIHIEYHMTQTLLDWGIEPVRPMWPEKDKGTVDLET